MKNRKRSFVEQMYPIDYLKRRDYAKILQYQYNIKITPEELRTLELSQNNAFSKLYDFVTQNTVFTPDFGQIPSFLETKEWKKNDIIYLALKEHLFCYYEKCVNDAPSTPRKTYNKVKLNEIYAKNNPPFKIQEKYRKYANVPHIQQLNAPDMMVILGSREPYNVIPFQMINNANINPILRYSKNNGPSDIPSDWLTNYLLAHEVSLSTEDSDSSESRYTIGHKRFTVDEIDRFFDTTYNFIKLLKGNEFSKLNDWESFSQEDQHIILSLLVIFFGELYDLYASRSNAYSVKKEPLWNELSSKQKNNCKEDLKKHFNNYYKVQHQRQRAKRSTTLTVESYKEYTIEYCKLLSEAFKKHKENLSALHNLSAFWISETLLPTLTISNLVTSDSIKFLLQNMKKTYGPSHKRYYQNIKNEQLDLLAHLLHKLSLCPNIFNQGILLEHFCKKYEPYSNFDAWYKDTNSMLDFFISRYYPLLESSFHRACELYKKENGIERSNTLIPISSLDISIKYRKINEAVKAPAFKTIELTCEQAYLLEKTYHDYLEMYNYTKDRRYQRLDQFEREEI